MEPDCRSTSLHTHCSIGLRSPPLTVSGREDGGLLCVAHAEYRASDSEKPPVLAATLILGRPSQPRLQRSSSDLKSVPRPEGFSPLGTRSTAQTLRKALRPRALTVRSPVIALASGHRFARPHFWASLRSPSLLGIASLALASGHRFAPGPRLDSLRSCCSRASSSPVSAAPRPSVPPSLASSARKMSIMLSSCCVVAPHEVEHHLMAGPNAS